LSKSRGATTPDRTTQRNDGPAKSAARNRLVVRCNHLYHFRFHLNIQPGFSGFALHPAYRRDGRVCIKIAPAAGKGEINRMFERDEEKSPYDRLMRAWR
jgi:hypothetical protein